MNQIESLFEDLHSPDSGVRFTLLSRLEKNAWTIDELALLQEYAHRETDPATRFHLELIRQLADPSLEPPLPGQGLRRIEEILAVPDPDFMALLLHIRRLPAGDMHLVLDALREYGLAGFPEEVLPFLLGVFTHHGSTSDVAMLEEFCRHPNPRVLSAAVEAIERIQPTELKPLLVPLLSNSSPGIASKAIRLLYRWDKPEAIRHLEAMMASEELADRQAALLYAFFFPFAEIERCVLRLLSLEEDPVLVRQAGQLCVINPSMATALRLMDLFETATGPKRDQIKATLLGIIDFLCRAKLSDKSPTETLEALKRQYREHRLQVVLQRCSGLLVSPNAEDRSRALERLQELARQGVAAAAEALHRHLATEPDPDLKARFLDGSHSESVEKLQRLEAIRTQNGTRDAPEVLDRLSDSDERVTIKALWVCAELELTIPEPRFTPLLEAANPEVAREAARIFVKQNKRAALEAFGRMLFSSQPGRRLRGLLCLDTSDFAATRELLLKAFWVEQDSRNLQEFGVVLGNQMSEELLIDLIRQNSATPSPGREVREAFFPGWAEQVRRVSTSPEPDTAILLTRLRAKALSVVSTTICAAEYSVENIRKKRATTVPASPPASSLPPFLSPSLSKSSSSSPPSSPTPAEPEKPADSASLTLLDEHPELRAEDPVLRFLAWERFATRTPIPAWRTEIAAWHATEPDPVFRFQSGMVLARWHLAESPASPQTLQDMEEYLQRPTPDFQSALLLAEGLTRRDAQALLAILRQAPWWNWPPAVLPFGLALLKRFGAPEDGPRIEPFCRHADPRVLVAAVEALEKLNPDELKPHLISLLTHSSPGVRSLGIRLLYKWDREEALKHFAGALRSPDAAERQAALHFAYFLPFPAIQPFLLRFLHVEQDLTAVRRAGYLFRVNPRPEDPHELMRVLEGCAGSKRQTIQEIINGVIEFLSKSGLVKQPPDEIAREIAATFQCHKAAELLESCLSTLASPDPELRRAALTRLTEAHRAGQAIPAEPLHKALTGENDPDARRLLQTLLGQPPGPGRQASPHFSARPESGQSPELLKKALTAKDPSVVIASIQGLAVIAPAELKAYFKRLTEHSSAEVKIVALRAFAGIEPTQALVSCEQLIGSRKPGERSVGFFAAGQFEFPLIRDLVIHSLHQEDQGANLRQIQGLLAPHLTPELYLEVCDVMSENTRGNQPDLAAFLEDLGTTLVTRPSSRFPTIAALREWVDAGMQKTAQKRSQPLPAYAFQTIQKLRQNAKVAPANPPGLIERVQEWLGPTPLFANLRGYALLLIIALPLAGLLSIGDESSPSVPASPVFVPAPALQKGESFAAGKIIGIQGEVKQRSGEGVRVLLDGSGDVLFVRFSGTVPPYSIGDPFRARVKMTKKGSDAIQTELLHTY